MNRLAIQKRWEDLVPEEVAFRQSYYELDRLIWAMYSKDYKFAAIAKYVGLSSSRVAQRWERYRRSYISRKYRSPVEEYLEETWDIREILSLDKVLKTRREAKTNSITLHLRQAISRSIRYLGDTETKRIIQEIYEGV